MDGCIGMSDEALSSGVYMFAIVCQSGFIQEILEFYLSVWF